MTGGGFKEWSKGRANLRQNGQGSLENNFDAFNSLLRSQRIYFFFFKIRFLIYYGYLCKQNTTLYYLYL
jgi:hypothetical protein